MPENIHLQEAESEAQEALLSAVAQQRQDEKILWTPSQPSWWGLGGGQVFLCPLAGTEVAYRASFRSSRERDTGQQAGSFKEPLPGRLCPDIVYTDQ